MERRDGLLLPEHGMSDGCWANDVYWYAMTRREREQLMAEDDLVAADRAVLLAEVAAFDRGEGGEDGGGSAESRALLLAQGFVNRWDWEESGDES